MLKIRILTASILLAALLVCLFALPAPWTVLVFGAVFTLAAWEWTGFGSLRGRAARIAYTAAIAALLALTWLWSASSAHLLPLLGLACVWWAIAFLWLTLAPGRHHPALALVCAIPVLVPAFIALARIQVSTGGFARGPDMVLWMLFLVFAADIGAFFAGRSLGRHKLAPQVSPGKTWEGAIGGLAAVALIALAGTLHFGLPVAFGVAFGGAVGVFSIIGDLTESMFKRGAGLKDSGSLLPGHGGILDRIDSVTAAAPLYALGLFGSGVIK
ncbi:MAG TPA: phosphatidate cytidylyltransferase [Steroidobacteraceae bacterium]|jgi:phosphatidate cytidylyltransferase|nr:phosphatidate cytidylyltransferase [Steroidobacteraceae bacterium]